LKSASCSHFGPAISTRRRRLAHGVSLHMCLKQARIAHIVRSKEDIRELVLCGRSANHSADTCHGAQQDFAWTRDTRKGLVRMNRSPLPMQRRAGDFRDTWDKSPEERAFLNKLDAALLTYAALSYFSKYLDQQNITVSRHAVSSGTMVFIIFQNAYVSGMQEE
jgi:hypothetical protein